MDVLFTDHTMRLEEKYQQLIFDLLEFAGKQLEVKEDTEMSVTCVDNKEIQNINATYRGKDQVTDVISFAIEDETDEDLDLSLFDIPRNIGDIFISIDRTKEQAEWYHHSFERELGFLTIHGFLHLMGYDHMTAEEEKEMFTLQRKILDDYGLQR